MSTRRLKVGIIGCGMIARKRHFPEMSENENVQIAACCDYVLERSREMAEKYGGTAYDDYRRMLKNESLDLVVVCSNNITHAQTTIDALKAGCHVLCEKPMCVSMEEAEAMIRTAAAAGKKLMIAHNQRMSSAYKKAKEILNTKKLGKVLTFRTVFGHPGCEYWAIDKKNSWFFDKKLAGFGCVADLGVHKIDLMRWLLDDEFEDACAFCGTLDKRMPDGAPISVDDNMVGILRSKSGIFGTIATSWTYYGPEDNSTILYCQKGILSVCADPKFQVKVDYPDGTQELYVVGGVGSNDKPIKTGIDDEFVNAVLEDRTPAIPGEEGCNSLAVALALDESARLGTIVKVKHYQK